MPIERDNVAAISLNDFSGGMNSAVPPHMLGENEFQMVKNFEYDMNILRTRGGISEPLATYPVNIKAFCYDNGTNTYLVCLENGEIYEEDLGKLHNKVGTLDGKGDPTFCFFDNKIFIASGGHLQYYDYQKHTVTTIAASYLCDYVFERMGRLVICHEGDDNLYYSATGDPYETGWKENTNDDSSSKFIEIGYKDNGDILKVLPMSGDIVAFKTNGRVYGLSGEYPSWNLTLIGEKSDVINGRTILNLGPSVAFMTGAGLKSLDAIQTYGNFTTNEIGRKINRCFIGNVYNPAMYNITRKRQLLIIPNTSDDENRKKVYCFQYDVGAGIYFEFSMPVTDMADTQDGVMFACGKSLHRWDDKYVNDNGKPIEQEIKTRKINSTRRIFTRRIEAAFKGSGLVLFKWAGKTVKHKVGTKRNVTNFFSSCHNGELTIQTKDNIVFEYANLYYTEK